jgi:hypothetical protein
MADLVDVIVTNKTGARVGLRLDPDGEQLAYLRLLLKRDDLDAVDVAKPAARKPVAAK